MNHTQRQLVLNKGNEQYIYRYEVGSEDDLLDALMDQAADNRTDFDWFDAAVLSFRLTRHLISQAEQLIGETSNTEQL